MPPPPSRSGRQRPAGRSGGLAMAPAAFDTSAVSAVWRQRPSPVARIQHGAWPEFFATFVRLDPPVGSQRRVPGCSLSAKPSWSHGACGSLQGPGGSARVPFSTAAAKAQSGNPPGSRSKTVRRRDGSPLACAGSSAPLTAMSVFWCRPREMGCCRGHATASSRAGRGRRRRPCASRRSSSSRRCVSSASGTRRPASGYALAPRGTLIVSSGATSR